MVPAFDPAVPRLVDEPGAARRLHPAVRAAACHGAARLQSGRTPRDLRRLERRAGRQALGLRGAGMGFHSDGEDKPVPNAGSFLYARQVPPEGGDTLFADMYAAHAALPAEIRRKIAGRRARFSRNALHHLNYPHQPLAPEHRTRPDVYHPLERRHPKSGRVSLYIGRWAYDIEGLTGAGRPRTRELAAGIRATAAISSTATAGGSATRSCGTTAARSTARPGSTRAATPG